MYLCFIHFVCNSRLMSFWCTWSSIFERAPRVLTHKYMQYFELGVSVDKISKHKSQLRIQFSVNFTPEWVSLVFLCKRIRSPEFDFFKIFLISIRISSWEDCSNIFQFLLNKFFLSFNQEIPASPYSPSQTLIKNTNE